LPRFTGNDNKNIPLKFYQKVLSQKDSGPPLAQASRNDGNKNGKCGVSHAFRQKKKNEKLLFKEFHYPLSIVRRMPSA